MRITEIYYDVKWTIWAIVKYFNVMRKMRPWNYSYLIDVQKRHVELMKNELFSDNETDETKNPKLKQMERFIELADNYLRGDYAERAGWKHGNIKFVEEEGSNGKMFRMVEENPPLTKEENKAALELSNKMANDEWNEMHDIIKGNQDESNWKTEEDYKKRNGTDARGWWS